MRILGTFVIGVIYLAIVAALVRPGSPAAGVVKTLSDAATGVVAAATGYRQTPQ